MNTNWFLMFLEYRCASARRFPVRATSREAETKVLVEKPESKKCYICTEFVLTDLEGVYSK